MRLVSTLRLVVLAACVAVHLAQEVDGRQPASKHVKRLTASLRKAAKASRAFDHLQQALARLEGQLPEALAEPGVAAPEVELGDRWQVLEPKAKLTLEEFRAGHEVGTDATQLSSELVNLAQALEANFAEVLDSVGQALPGDDVRLELRSRMEEEEAWAMVEDLRLQADQRVLQLSEAANEMSNPEILKVARRLGFRSASVMPRGRRDTIAEAKGRAAELQAIALEAQQAMPKASAPGYDAAVVDGDCSMATVRAVGSRLDRLAQSFSPSIQRIMLPPEAANLQRVIHALEVMRSSILGDLAMLDHGAGSVLLENTTQVCIQYFSGVRQLDADLQHYRGMLEKQRAEKQRRAAR
mmetsp:Transcript_65303/g.156096  ORF Transcript_65303/g.156096 Transcript_65303/m.156096 type:complete len:354 (-) Transcript_65303:217-1278(-)